MYYLWLLPAAFCLIYYSCCVVYAGRGSSFITIWLMGAAFFTGIFGFCVAVEKEIITAPLWLIWTFRIFMAAILCSFVIIELLVTVNLRAKPYVDCEYLIILGCRVKGTEVSKSLKARLDAALAYIEGNENVTIIVSGGQGRGEEISEAQAMKEYLVAHGIAQTQILMEDKSADTSENIRFSAEYIGNAAAKIGVVSNDFHLFRAKYLVWAQGFSNVCGIAAPTDRVLFLNYMIREYFGVLKDLFTGNLIR